MLTGLLFLGLVTLTTADFAIDNEIVDEPTVKKLSRDLNMWLLRWTVKILSLD